MKSDSLAAVFVETGKELEMRRFVLPSSLAPGEVICKILMSTICGSDIHTIMGRRREPAPLILGHEIIGQIVAMGDGVEKDGFGERLAIGDRISWSIMASCGRCYFCTHDLPQKCESLRKYGHSCCDEPPHLTGGYAQHVCLLPGTAIFKVPADLPDAVATPANCALSTVINGVETIGLDADETVLIQGAGLLGLNLVALAKETRARHIIVTDISQDRLELAKQFGATMCLNLAQVDASQVAMKIRDITDQKGADVAFEVCGSSNAPAQACDALRIGGRYLVAGLVMPNSDLGIDGNTITRKCLTIKGIHNYKPRHLGLALRFLDDHWRDYPYAGLVGETFDLQNINDAIALAQTNKHIRIAVCPT